MLLLLAGLPSTQGVVRYFFMEWLTRIGHMQWVVVVATAMLAGVHLLNTTLQRRNIRWLEWSLFKVRANMSLLPLTHKWSGLAYAALLYFCIPILACVEEVIFRGFNDTIAKKLLWGMLAFGLAHLLALVTVRMAGVLALLGGVLVVVYQVEGLVGAFMVHATYNVITLSVIIFEMRIREPLGAWLAKHRFARIHLPTVVPWLLRSSEWYA